MINLGEENSLCPVLHNLPKIQEQLKQGLIILEYLNGNLGIAESGEILGIGYRGFLDLLWSKGLNIDGLTDQELEQEVDYLQGSFSQSC